MATEKSQALNILVLGPTGVGKSTFINALYTYLRHQDLTSALSSELQLPVPFRFSITDEHFRSHSVSFGSDPNELFVAGQSSTQQCKAHEMWYAGHRLRIFDTPGMGGTRGLEQDERNFKQTMDILYNYEDLHLMVILLKPNEARLTTSFVHCVENLLLKLPKNASGSVVFVFTNGRDTYFRPGDTLKPLNKILDRVRAHLDIRLDSSNLFCVDNDVFRFIAALKQGVEWDAEGYEGQWTRNRKEFLRLLDHVVNKKPTPLKIRHFLDINNKDKFRFWLKRFTDKKCLFKVICATGSAALIVVCFKIQPLISWLLLNNEIYAKFSVLDGLTRFLELIPMNFTNF